MGRMPDKNSLTGRWLRGEVEIGAGKGLAKQKPNPEYKFGQYCPRKCGTFLRRETPEKLGAATLSHMADPKQCVNHPRNVAKTGRRKLPRRGV